MDMLQCTAWPVGWWLWLRGANKQSQNVAPNNANK